MCNLVTHPIRLMSCLSISHLDTLSVSFTRAYSIFLSLFFCFELPNTLAPTNIPTCARMYVPTDTHIYMSTPINTQIWGKGKLQTGGIGRGQGEGGGEEEVKTKEDAQVISLALSRLFISLPL